MYVSLRFGRFCVVKLANIIKMELVKYNIDRNKNVPTSRKLNSFFFQNLAFCKAVDKFDKISTCRINLIP